MVSLTLVLIPIYLIIIFRVENYFLDVSSLEPISKFFRNGL